jgi:enoyl-CoA hydratase/3-hydroxyacyl-CoA dehydrogenase
MLRDARRLDAGQAQAAGIISGLADDYAGLIRLAVAEVGRLAARPRPRFDEPVSVTPFAADAGSARYSREVAGIIEEAVRAAAAAPTLGAALETGYLAFGRTACTAAAREGIAAFGERRKPDFARTG